MAAMLEHAAHPDGLAQRWIVVTDWPARRHPQALVQIPAAPLGKVTGCHEHGFDS
jgi:hypothetical protein